MIDLLTENEAGRLSTLRRYDILDTLPEQAFDDLVALAAQVCQVPTAFVGFIDERSQWFKARLGPHAKEMPRDGAFCAYTILQPDQMLEVPDASEDGRFAQNPLVTSEPRIRFYAGVALVTPDGFALGTLGVMDGKPRTLTREQVAGLRALGRQAMAQLEFRRCARPLEGGVAEKPGAPPREPAENPPAEESVDRRLDAAEQSRQALLGVLEDEMRSGQKLRESEERFRQLAENINEVFWMSNPERSAFLYISPAYQAIWGRACETLYDSPVNWLETIHPNDRPRVEEAIAKRQAAGKYDEVYRILRPDGVERWIRDRAFPVRNENGEIYRMVGTAQDITERKHGEMRATVEHGIIGLLSEGAPFADTMRRIIELVCRGLEWDLGDLWQVDRDTVKLRCVESWHRPADDFHGFVKASKNLLLAVGDGLPGQVWRAKDSQWVSDVSLEATFVRRKAAAHGLRAGLAFPIRSRGDVFGVLEFFSLQARAPDAELLRMCDAIGAQIGHFIERKQLEDQFLQAQKMEAIGTLAGGIAHDFNNVLTAIVAYAELAKAESRANPEVVEYLNAVLDGGRRAADLVRQILAFSRLQEQQREPLELWRVVEEALKLLRATIPATIEFDILLARGGPSILADSTQIHQVIMNLATNAAHAMRDRPGRLGVVLEKLEVDSALASLHPGLRAGPYLRLGISDTGRGMEQATLSRIFDPFFTTKAPGEGTGLGLAVVHGIMQNHDGVITVFSRPGEGTRFQLYFPTHLGDTPDSPAHSGETPRGHGERLLFVDDEPALATMGRKTLERLGYVVESYTGPKEVLEAVRAAPDKYDLLVTDLAMPGMNGLELAETILKIRPDLPILLITGYSATFTPDRARAVGIKELLLKPMTLHSLGAAVYRLISGRSRG